MKSSLAARLLLTLGALLPYWRLFTFRVIYVTDDYFASDIFNGELPGRVLIGQMIRHGQMPVWTNQLCSGLPLAGSPADPIGLAAFSLLPPAAALDLFVIVLLLVAAHGAYGLARRLRADRTSAVLAGIAFAGSGYIACQLKHLGIVSTVVWLPIGLLLIDRAVAICPESETPTRARRALFMGAFGLVFAEQALSGFPQSVYICGLVYAAFALFRAVVDRRRLGTSRASTMALAALGLAAALGAAAGAVVLLPLSQLGSLSDRGEDLGWVWASRLAYWPPNFLTFLSPYIYGDISNNTYVGPPFFWEDYGYVGIATFLLALYGGVRERRRPMVAYSIAMTLVAYLLVLGPATPAFHVAYLLLPGMNMFRFPTRFLIVVELGLAVLAAVGLTRLRADLERHWKPPSHLPLLIVFGICAGTAVDLFVHQPRQNPMVAVREWLAPPAGVAVIRADNPQPRTFTPRHRDLHRRAFQAAHGWADVDPYFELRDVLEPNTGGGFWDTPSADCYAGITPRWYVDVWGDHNREASVMSLLAVPDFDSRTLRVHALLPKLLRTYGVTHLLSRYPQQGAALTFVSHDGSGYIYRIEGAARVRFVRAARRVASERDAVARLLSADFDPDREVLLHDSPESVGPTVAETGATAPNASPPPAAVRRETSREIVIDANVPADGFLLLADTFYPGWTAQVDGTPTPIYRANLSVRAIQLPKGRHEIVFRYTAPGFYRGLEITLLAVGVLVIWTGGAAYAG
ncbi:MAG TPA: YfhO family protein, partial [Vicinamibacterales bacterium]|nr:YfhO family protein [Vicinamibacterales bacterium]